MNARLLLACGMLALISVPAWGAEVQLATDADPQDPPPAGEAVLLAGLANEAGRVDVEESRWPYAAPRIIRSFAIAADVPEFSLAVRAPVNARYRAILSPATGAAPVFSEVVPVWRVPAWNVRHVRQGTQTLIQATAALPPGIDTTAWVGQPMYVWTRHNAQERVYTRLPRLPRMQLRGRTMRVVFPVPASEDFHTCLQQRRAPGAWVDTGFENPQYDGGRCRRDRFLPAANPVTVE